MKRWVCDYAWLGGEDLATDVLIEVRDGVFTRVEQVSGGGAPRLSGVALPGLVNAHSHAFHRALRGLTHRQGGDFWLWRERMYEVAGRLEPETYEEMATDVYTEMAQAGITTVGEFHYLHNQVDGTPYDDANEMGHALIRAARRAGINICLLDAGYFRAGFGSEDLDPVQRRFSDGSAEAWLERVESLATTYAGASDVKIGYAPHSTRAVSADDLAFLAEHRDALMPIHIHLSEQPAENTQSIQATGMTPTGVLERAGLLGEMTTAVHATHLTAADIDALGSSGTNVCYCPTTERELADGIGPAGELAAAGCSICVGSDSHAVIDIFEEARGIELHNRLATGKRGRFSPSHLLASATSEGASSLGFERPGISVGSEADFIVIDAETPRTRGIQEEDGAGQVLFSAFASDVSQVFVAGEPITPRASGDL